MWLQDVYIFKLIEGNRNWTRGSRMRLVALKVSHLSTFFNYIINGVLFLVLNTFSDTTFILSLLKSNLIPKRTFLTSLWRHNCVFFKNCCHLLWQKSVTENVIRSHHWTMSVINNHLPKCLGWVKYFKNTSERRITSVTHS